MTVSAVPDEKSAAVSVLALIALVALLFTGSIPTVPPGAQLNPS